MSPDSNTPIVPPGSGQMEPPSEEEAKLFAELLDRAEGANGVVRLSHFPLVPGKSDQWPYWLLENRDCSGITQLIAATLPKVEETVIDRADCEIPRQGRKDAVHRTAAAHAIADAQPRMLALEHREETAELHLDSLGPRVLDGYMRVAKDNGLDVAAAPLFGLEPELADAAVRRQLLKLGISYSLLLNPFHWFLRVFSRPHDSWDVVDWIAVENLFDVHKPDRDKSKPDFLLVGDLTTGDSEPRRPVAEFVVEIPTEDPLHPLHFLTLPALPPPTKKHEQEQHSGKAIEMAERAAQHLRESPAAALRAHEFHHRRTDVYCRGLQIAQWGRLI